MEFFTVKYRRIASNMAILSVKKKNENENLHVYHKLFIWKYLRNNAAPKPYYFDKNLLINSEIQFDLWYFFKQNFHE